MHLKNRLYIILTVLLADSSQMSILGMISTVINIRKWCTGILCTCNIETCTHHYKHTANSSQTSHSHKFWNIRYRPFGRPPPLSIISKFTISASGAHIRSFISHGQARLLTPPAITSASLFDRPSIASAFSPESDIHDFLPHFPDYIAEHDSAIDDYLHTASLLWRRLGESHLR